ncbi:MAG: aromatic ring-hydroxylating oxygenase subunit alpha [Acidimicrobiales bacterium]
MPAASRYDELIRRDRVHGSLYTDPAIWEDELRRIWYRTWVFVGHESEVPDAGDFVAKSIGPQPVIMMRGRDGVLRLFLNRCPHRANTVCEAERGNANALKCAYHGWTFSNTGELLAFPFASGYGSGEQTADFALAQVPRVGLTHGFVFASLAADGPTLAEHLGAAQEVFERLSRLSPEGRVELTAGWLRHRVRANWKLLLENETDGYHPSFVHASIFSVAESAIGALYGDKSAAVSRDLGNGHTEDDLRPEFRKRAVPMGWFGTTADKLPAYAAKMRDAYGEAAEQILIDGSPHVMVFPNLFVAEIQLFVLQPLAVDETVQHVTALQFAGAPELNERMLRQTNGSVGPAGFLLADDSELYERNQRGARAVAPEWLVIRRGLHRERLDDGGFRVGHVTDEVAQRGIWRHYRSLMEQP